MARQDQLEAPPPAYSANVTQRKIRNEMNRWLAEKAAGVSALLGGYITIF